MKTQGSSENTGRLWAQRTSLILSSCDNGKVYQGRGNLCSNRVHSEGITFPINADEPPRRAIPTATLAGAPPGAFLKAGASANDKPLTVGTKSISISPKQTISEESLVSRGSLFPETAFIQPIVATKCQEATKKVPKM